MIQSEELVVSEAVMLEELGWTWEYLLIPALEGKVTRHYLLEIGLKKFLNDRKLLDDQIRNDDVVIYLTDSIEFGYGTCSTIFQIYL